MNTQPAFYGGEPRNLGLVAALPQTSFADLVREVFSPPVMLPLTRAQYQALPDRDPAAPRDKQRAKRTRFVIPGVIPDTTERRSGNVTHCNLVFIDIDDATPAEGILAQLPQMVNVLAPFNFAIYHTASSTPAKPRLRVVVEASAIPPEHYPAAVSTVARLMGLEEVTSESNVVCQPMFVPVMFRDDPADPLLVENLAGRAMTIEDVDGAALPTASRAAPLAGEYDLDYLRPPVEEITEADVTEALSHLDPDMERKQWVSIGAALKHQFGEAGIDLWRDWSAKGTKFGGDAEVETQWRSLKPTPRGRLPVTIRSLLKAATEAGWVNDAVVQRCYSTVNSWLSDAARTETELMKHGVAKIAAAPLLSHMERSALLNRLGQALKSRGVAVSRTDLNKQFRVAEVAARGKGGDDKTAPDSAMPPWARGIYYVAQPNEFHRPVTGQKWSVEALNNTFSIHLVAPGDTENGGRPAVLPQHYLLNQLNIKRVDNYLYAPTHPDRPVVKHDRKTFLNTYRATHPEPDYARADEAGAMVMAHCRELFNSEAEAAYVLDWLCYLIQNPGAKALWAVLLQGAEGCGKSVWFEMLRRVLGHTNVKEVSAAEVMESKWTEWAAETQAINIPEIRVVGESRHAVMNKLKTLIADKTISIAQRNQDTRSVPNYANYFLTTNHTDALALTQNDRRYYVVFSKLQTKAQVRALRESGHFQRLFDMLENNDAGLRAWFLTRAITPAFDPVIAPESAYKNEMLDAAATPLQKAVELALADGDSPLVKQDLVSVNALRSVLEAEHRGVGKFSDQSVASILRDLGYTNAGRHRIGGERQSLWTKGLRGDAATAATNRLSGQQGEELL